jgi:hypothetical protein
MSLCVNQSSLEMDTHTAVLRTDSSVKQIFPAAGPAPQLRRLWGGG